MTTMYWGFPLRSELYLQAQTVLEQIESGQGNAKHLNRQAAEVVHGLLQDSLQAYLYAPSSLITMSSAKRAVIERGGAVISGAINLIVKQFFGSLSLDRLQAVARYLDRLMWPPEAGSPPRLMFALEPEFYAAFDAQLKRMGQGHAGDSESSQAAADALAAQLQKLVETCIDHYYRIPADLVELKGMSRSVTSFGVDNVKKAFDSLLDRLLIRLEPEELTTISAYLESLLQEPRTA